MFVISSSQEVMFSWKVVGVEGLGGFSMINVHQSLDDDILNVVT